MSDLRGRDARGEYRYVDVATRTIASSAKTSASSSSATSPASTTGRKSPPAPTMPELPTGARRVTTSSGELVTLTARELARAEEIRVTPEAFAAAKVRVGSRRR